MCEAVKVGGGFRRRCVRQEPHYPPHSCVWETQGQSVEREIRAALNIPDKHDVIVMLSNGRVTFVSSAGHPLPPSSWQACVAAGLPMVAWEDGPDRHWSDAERAARSSEPKRMTGAQRSIRDNVEPLSDAEILFIDRSEEEWRYTCETFDPWIVRRLLATIRAYKEKAKVGPSTDAVLVAAGALIATWESGGISHRLGAHLFDLRAALNGATIPTPRTGGYDG